MADVAPQRSLWLSYSSSGGVARRQSDPQRFGSVRRGATATGATTTPPRHSLAPSGAALRHCG